MLDNAITVEPQQPARHCVIWLHGLGAGPEDFVPLAKQLKLPADAAVRFIFPAAPTRSVTVNAGYFMPAWYDILAFTPERQINHSHLDEVSEQIEQVIQQQVTLGIASENIFIAGFSQGGAVAYQCALNYPNSLGGLLCMSTYLLAESLPTTALQTNTPVLIQHGRQDDVVALNLGQQAFNQLQAQHYQVEFQQFDMAHSVSPSQVKAISAWLSHLMR
ncbi:alpha/beta hydrolase [Agarivorans sp. 1_MG-2023]|nr:dienelactone hydrolase family protein [Agarivorans sp. 1_MG-2023]MDO6766171.1 dienelactone hydrolase family protein [Agarivorans sp. 1_MG-2023]